MNNLDICIIKVGKVEDDSIEILQNGLKVYLGWNVKQVGEIKIPSQVYNPLRKQFNSSLILEQIRKEFKSKEFAFVLGITEVDLYVQGLNFVFGEADPVEKICIISSFRLKPEFYGDKPSKDLFERRLLTEAVHEIGHLLNLKHCPNPACVMFFLNSILDTDRKGFLFCDGCRSKLSI
ncbi:MAG: archaemetzincin family Zn-dependent metalloprotease [Candidatus Kryptonium sp.]